MHWKLLFDVATQTGFPARKSHVHSLSVPNRRYDTTPVTGRHFSLHHCFIGQEKYGGIDLYRQICHTMFWKETTKAFHSTVILYISMNFIYFSLLFTFYATLDLHFTHYKRQLWFYTHNLY